MIRTGQHVYVPFINAKEHKHMIENVDRFLRADILVFKLAAIIIICRYYFAITAVVNMV